MVYLRCESLLNIMCLILALSITVNSIACIGLGMGQAGLLARFYFFIIFNLLTRFRRHFSEPLPSTGWQAAPALVGGRSLSGRHFPSIWHCSFLGCQAMFATGLTCSVRLVKRTPPPSLGSRAAPEHLAAAAQVPRGHMHCLHVLPRPQQHCPLLRLRRDLLSAPGRVKGRMTPPIPKLKKKHLAWL